MSGAEQYEFKLHNVIECSRLGTWEWNVQTGETVFNEIRARIIGYTLDELTPVSITTWETFAHPGDLKISYGMLQEHFAGKIPFYDIECRMKHKDGHWVWVHDRGKVVSWTADGKPLMMFGTHSDISDRKRAEENQKRQAMYLETIIENQPGLVWLKDAEGRFLAVNKSFAVSCGHETPASIVGLTDLDIWPKALADKYRADDADVMASGVPKIVEELIADKGENCWFETFKSPITDDKGVIVGTTGYARDITGRKLMEEELKKSQKLESLGLLAGGIAHDFNNLLTGIFGYINMASGTAKEKVTRDYLANALGTIDRARSLTGQLITFAVGGMPIKKLERLMPFVGETARFALSGSNVSCSVAFPDDLWPCEYDQNQIGQVIDNIVINAQQAMPEGGTIGIEATNLQLDENSHATLPAGNYIKIKIIDHGIGMPYNIISRIFDPFFTTKARGHGLGLATCFSIVNRHGGHIEAESEPGKGSTFTIYLPASPEAVVSDRAAAQTVHHGSGSILVMDDEEVVRNVISATLKYMGYDVQCVSNAKETVELFERATNDKKYFTALFLDLTIPGGPGGRETIREIRKRDKDIPAFVISGYADNPVMANPSEYGFNGSICKPFTKDELAGLLNRHLRKKE